ncbi:unnamed protein product [Brassicogethes aeneus]|uniref:Gem-associated protein 8 n=1 Tax=Brassicogethes aeneus TaxID=1431903 RepID=A0A9P0FK16_BRAAE|nr:unnamed protein product [Brassicogethes aeneus]
MQRQSRCDTVNNRKTQQFKCKTTRKRNYRSLRRKRSKIRYYNSLKLHRYKRNTDSLCESIAVFDITDMECPPVSQVGLPQDVADWHKKEQIAYWKSRAISLEYENRMLYHHLKHMYVTQIEDYGNKEEFSAVEVEKEAEKVIPKEPEGKKRELEMKKIYGENYAKIMGMETAMQLNFERHSENLKAPHWPNVPLKF